MRVFDGGADLEKAVGTHLGHSQGHPVDPAKAAEGPFGSTVAHGFLTLSLLPVLTEQVYRVEGVKMLAVVVP